MGVGRLLALDDMPDCIWGDDDETIVYAQVIGDGKTRIFRFYLDPTKPPQSLATRIVSYYHERDDLAAAPGFADRGALHDAIWSTIASVWPECVVEPPSELGTVIDLSSNERGEATWRAYHEPLFEQYLSYLHGIQASELMPVHVEQPTPIVDISQLTFLSNLGGRGCSKKVSIQPSSTETGSRVGAGAVFVFKGVNFQTYLQVHDDDDKFARVLVETWRRSSRLVAAMQPNPHIQAAPEMLVCLSPASSQGKDNDTPGTVLVGHLSMFLSRGDLAAAIERANSGEASISPQQKAAWCLDMAKAIDYTHNAMHTHHMDIKPGNFLIDDSGSLRLIDWEQSGAPATTLAPEADGTWDVCEEEQRSGDKDATAQAARPRLIYTKYTGPARRNMPDGGGRAPFNIWNVFPVWQATCPRATELAEVFALGRTMWMLLAETVGEFDDVEHPDDMITWPAGGAIAVSCIGMVTRCMEKDPNSRPSAVEVVKFWEDELGKLS
ncbi:hypothetical protein SCUCBS95973_005914 [Sporothrix curviconia]|uniref:Protein kinase domain-containing protein n=1 Tax=Sporothrix curviconia TaxID=1260050 RepID=A0ABP0C0R7_9PEZI